MRGSLRTNGAEIRIEEFDHIANRSAHFCQELVAIGLTNALIGHKFDIAVDAG